MNAITLEDDDDVEFQADLARAIAASLEPDLAGPNEEVPRGDTSGWDALLAAGQAATWGRSALSAGRRSPALFPVGEDDDEFQRQIAAAMAASIQSAEEERRRRELGIAVGAVASEPLGHEASVQGPSSAPTQVPSPVSGRPSPPQQLHQPGSLLRNGGFIYCSGGLVLTPLVAGKWPRTVTTQAPVSTNSPFSTLGSEPWPASLPGAAPVVSHAAAQTAVASTSTLAAVGGPISDDEEARAVAAAAELGLPAPASSPCSSAADSEAPAGAGATSRAIPVAVRPDALLPPLVLDAALGRGFGGEGSGGQLLLSCSPAKHARTPSLAGAMDSSQPQMKRSRAASDIGAAVPSAPGQVLAGRLDNRERRAANSIPRALEGLQVGEPDATTVVVGGPCGDSSIGCGSGFGDNCREGEAAAAAQSHSPPERPASAASGCTPYVPGEEEDGDCVADVTACDPAEAALAEPPQQRLATRPPSPVPHGDDAVEVLDLELQGYLPPSVSTAGCNGFGVQEQSGAGGGHYFGNSQGERTGGGGCGRCGTWPPASGARLEGARALPTRSPQKSSVFRKEHLQAPPGSCGGGNGLESGSDRYTGLHLDLSVGIYPGGHQNHAIYLQRYYNQHHHQTSMLVCEERQGSGMSDLSTLQQHHHQQEQQQFPAMSARRSGISDGGCGGVRGSSLAPLDLSRPAQDQVASIPADLGAQGLSVAYLRWPHDLAGPANGPVPASSPVGKIVAAAAAAEAAGQIEGEPPATDPMLTDSPSFLQQQQQTADHVAGIAALVERRPAGGAGGVGVGVADAVVATGSWGYSGAHRRMLLHQRVWWWLGPGQVQTGRITSIDRRSEPLLYSVRLDVDGTGAEGQTIIATADCLFPYLSHGDKLMCRLPPSACDNVCSSSGSDSAVGELQQPGGLLQRRFEEPGCGAIGEEGRIELDGRSGSAGGVDDATGAGPCAWMCGVLLHCIFDGHVPMVHVLLGPDEVPYTTPYELAVPVRDVAEGSGCTAASGVPGAAAGTANSVTIGPHLRL